MVSYSVYLIHTEPIFGGTLAANCTIKKKIENKLSNQGVSGPLSGASSFSGHYLVWIVQLDVAV